jgi:hypothetical protein
VDQIFGVVVLQKIWKMLLVVLKYMYYNSTDSVWGNFCNTTDNGTCADRSGALLRANACQ